MKTKTFLFSLVIWGSSVSILEGQIRSDFTLAAGGARPSIALDDMGRIHATWRGGGIYYGIFDSLGNSLKDSQRIAIGFVDAPQIAAQEKHVVVVWHNLNASANSDVYCQLLTTGGDPLFPFFDLNNSGFNSGFPDVAFLNDSTFFTVWEGEQTETGTALTGIYGQLATTSARFIDTTQLLNDDTPKNFRRDLVRIASHHQSENVVVVWWESLSPSNYRIFGRVFSSSATPLSATFLISETPDSAEVWSPSVFMDATGDFKVVWSIEKSYMDWDIYLRRFGADGVPLGPSQKVNDESGVYAAVVDISQDFDGKLVVVWEGLQNNTTRIMAQRFASDGSLVGSNFKLSATADSINQYFPSVVLRNGKIYSAWQEAGAIRANIIDFDNVPVSVKDRNDEIPGSFHILQSYPNPFNPSTTIKFSLPHRAQVRLIIYDVLGNEIITLKNQEMVPGIHEVVWAAKDMRGFAVPSGVYFCRFETEMYTEIRKMLLIR